MNTMYDAELADALEARTAESNRLLLTPADRLTIDAALELCGRVAEAITVMERASADLDDALTGQAVAQMRMSVSTAGNRLARLRNGFVRLERNTNRPGAELSGFAPQGESGER